MQVLDYDRFSKDDPIGELCIPMSEFDLVTGQTLWKNLQPSEGATVGYVYGVLYICDVCMSCCVSGSNPSVLRIQYEAD